MITRYPFLCIEYLPYGSLLQDVCSDRVRPVTVRWKGDYVYGLPVPALCELPMRQ